MSESRAAWSTRQWYLTWFLLGQLIEQIERAVRRCRGRAQGARVGLVRAGRLVDDVATAEALSVVLPLLESARVAARDVDREAGELHAGVREGSREVVLVGDERVADVAALCDDAGAD